MGFDIECIVDIQSYPGEYFCPVCRTLAIPNEAHQAQCTHLYCKPCLAYVANGSRACPYDGYLVTEADSKLLSESNKTLAENIGKVKVRCLYQKSGCIWEGLLSDCTSHCSGCTFGGSPVVCNRCGVQILHRQVNEHAQICSGVFPAQQAANVVPSSGAAVTSAHQITTAALLPGQNSNQQTNASSQPPAPTLAAVPTSEHQWYLQQYHYYYQQQYQQFCQQQAYQLYHPYQQQSILQQPLVNMEFNSQLPPPPPPPSQPHAQPQVQAMAQQLQNLVQVNPQLQIPSTIQPNSQISSQVYPTSHAQPPTLSPAYPQHYPMQSQPPTHLHPPQSAQAQPHPYLQPHLQVQPQEIVQHHPQSHGQLRILQAGQPGHVQAQTLQTLHSTANTFSSLNAYPQPQPMQQMPVGVTHQPPMCPPPTGGGSMPPVQTHGQVPQQPFLVRPPQDLTANQQPGQIPSRGQALVHSQIHSTAHQAGHPVQQHPIQPNQEPISRQYSQQQALPGAYSGQSHQQGFFIHPQPLQSQFRPQGPNVVPQTSHMYVQPQQNVEKQKHRKNVYEKIVKEEGIQNCLELRSAAKSADVAVEPEKNSCDDAPKEQDQSLANPASSDAADGTIPGKNTHKNAVDREGFHHFGHGMPPPKYGPSAQQRPVGPKMIPPMPPPGRTPRAHVPGYSSNAIMPSGDMAQADQPFNSGGHHPLSRKQHGSGFTTPFGRGPGRFFPPGDLREGIVPSGTSVNPAGPGMFQNQRVNQFDRNQPNPSPQESFEKIPFGQHSRVESVMDKRLKAPMGENLGSLPVPHDQASRPLGKPPRGFGYDSGLKLDGGAGGPPNRLLPPYNLPGPMHFKDSGEREPPLCFNDDDRKMGRAEFGMHKVDFFSGRNPDREFLNVPPRGLGSHSGFEDIGGREPQQSNEGSRPFNFPSNATDGFDGRFYPFHGELIERHKLGMPQFREPGSRGRYPNPGCAGDAFYAGDLSSLDGPRKQISIGWCGICNYDCETVEGLNMHYQTPEHLNMAVGMVKIIKQQNRKKQMMFSNQGTVGVKIKRKSRRAAFRGRGRRA